MKVETDFSISKAMWEANETVSKELELDGGKFAFYASRFESGLRVSVVRKSLCLKFKEFNIFVTLHNEDILETETASEKRKSLNHECVLELQMRAKTGYFVDDELQLTVRIEGVEDEEDDSDSDDQDSITCDWEASDFSSVFGKREKKFNINDVRFALSFERKEEKDALFSAVLSVTKVQDTDVDNVDASLTLQCLKPGKQLTRQQKKMLFEEGKSYQFDFDIKQSEMADSGYVNEKDEISLVLVLTQSEHSYDNVVPSGTGKVVSSGYYPQTSTSYASSSHATKVTTKYAGLENQGATCYMNAMLQALFHIPAFRKCVYEMPTTGMEDVAKSIPLNLQRLFAQMQLGKRACSTKPLTKSFGWDSGRTYIQHDTQEFCRVLMDNLEEKMKGSPLEGRIAHLFRGKYRSYVRCVNVKYESSRIEEFYDLAMQVKDCPTLEESFEKYVESEKLEGENQYKTDEFGMQDAQMGIEFVEFPPVLQLHLRRFEYDFEYDRNVKINSKFEFPMEIDLDDYLAEDAPKDVRNHYELYGVLVHSGDVSFGHYYAFLRTPPTAREWYKFNDSTVSIAEQEDAVDSNFGGTKSSGYSYGYSYGSANAYILVYVRKDSLQELFEPVPDSTLPQHLKEFVEHAKEEKSTSKTSELSCYLLDDSLRVNTRKNVQGYICPEMAKKTKYVKAHTNEEVYSAVAALYDCDPLDIRIWYGSTYPYYELERKNTTNYLEWYPNLFIVKARQEKPEQKYTKSLVMCLKFFNPKWKFPIEYVKTMIINPEVTVSTLLEQVRTEVGIPPETPLKAFEETQSKYVRELDLAGYLDKPVSDVHVTSPAVIIFQVDPTVSIPEITFTPAEIPTTSEQSSSSGAEVDEKFKDLPVLSVDEVGTCETVAQYFSENVLPKLTIILLAYEDRKPLAVLKVPGTFGIVDLPKFVVSGLHLDIDLTKDAVLFYKTDTYDDTKPATYGLHEYSYKELSSAFYHTNTKNFLFMRVLQGVSLSEVKTSDVVTVTVKKLDKTTETLSVAIPKSSKYKVLRDKLIERGYLQTPCREYALKEGMTWLTPESDLYYCKDVTIEELAAGDSPTDDKRELAILVAGVDSTDYLAPTGDVLFVNITEGDTIEKLRPQLQEKLEIAEDKMKRAKFFKGERWVRFDRKTALKDDFDLHSLSQNESLYLVINTTRKSRYGRREEALKIDN